MDKVRLINMIFAKFASAKIKSFFRISKCKYLQLEMTVFRKSLIFSKKFSSKSGRLLFWR